ncbi:PilC/PilY family type IV pilus protein [Pseudoalteromonas sp.]|uniref:pilus assembly protein n=1 Tax=Pseudoalteromonas sp. TaxID=53249 RepID=UPI001BCB8637|nr:PilC/PilY family type IV pilus protein [Pseudoalteromonas sp.]
MKRATNLVLTYIMCLFFTMTAAAEDIELYVNKDANIDEKPRVLFIFDTSGSMAWDVTDGGQCYKRNNGRFYQAECFKSRPEYNMNQQCYKAVNGYAQAICEESRLSVAKNAMKQLVKDNDDIDFGLMRFNYNAGNEPGGGYVLARIGANENTLDTKINNLPAYGSTPLTETLWEAYLYITGKSIKFADGVQDRDKSVDNNQNYKSPFRKDKENSLRCDNSINVILMTDGEPQNDGEANTDINNTHKSLFNRDANSFGYYNSYLVALARILHGTEDKQVDLYPSTTDSIDTARLFTIGFGNSMRLEALDLLEEAAKVGGGKYLHANSADQLSEAFKNTITLIREENSTFTSPSFASNNVDQTRSKDAVYFAMFYPEVGTRWRGNLKKLKVAGSTLIDSSSKPALNSDGLISNEAKTFWTTGNIADGNSVKNGGVNAMLANTTPNRRLLFSDRGVFTPAEIVKSFNNNKQAAADFFTVTKNDLDSTINWARGVDVDNENSGSTQRADIFGDPLHSKPVAIDYGNNDVRILIGTNAGFLHMFKDDDSKNEVTESWAFIPSALFNIIKPLRAKETGKVYGMDGPISVYSKNESLDTDGKNDGIIDASKGDTVWAFAGMRRGGKNYYGLDITKPDSPSLMWSIKGGVADFKELGQSWSKPQVAFIKAFGDNPVLVFGGGYDTIKDKDKGNKRDADSMGRDVFIVDAQTGIKLWSLRSDNRFNGQHSIAADVTLLDSNYDGYIDRIYAADTGGDIWRIDMPGNQTSEFSHFKLASLAGGKDRRFFYKPAIARTMFSKVTENKGVISRVDTPYDAIIIGSGDRTNPINSTTADELFVIRDEHTVTKTFLNNAPETISSDNLMSMNDDKFGNALSNVDEFIRLEIELTNKFKGWHYALSPGEKSLASATVVGGVAYFTSFTPASDSTENQCSLTGGGGSLYAFHLHYGTKVYDNLKFATSTEVPDTPQLYFGGSCIDSNADGKCDDDSSKVPKSQFYLIGPGIKGQNAENPLRPIEIIGPGLNVVDGKIKLVNDTQPIGFGFKTQQMYIYKREENDEVSKVIKEIK